MDWIDDFDKLRENEIAIINSQFPYVKNSIFNERFVFYYDETNNFRKVRLAPEKGGVNIENINTTFVLGGILLDEEVKPISIEEAKKLFNMQPTVKEIKLTHFGKGNFLDILNSSKLLRFWNWLLENNIYIHLSATNILYFSIVDIIDSVLALNFEEWQKRMQLYYTLAPNTIKNAISFENYHLTCLFLLKDELYRAIIKDIDNVIKLFIRYQYPNIKKVKITEFYRELFSILKIHEERFPHLYTFLELFSEQKDAPFITDNESYILLDNFFVFYMRPVNLFRNSYHIFDAEKTIIKDFQRTFPLNNYEFQDSIKNIFIQFSDVVVGFAGKLFDFILHTNKKSIASIILSEIQKQNLSKWLKIVNLSEGKCPAFHHVVMPLKTFREKIEIFYSKVF